jgi:hypothetical protein
MYAKGRQHQIAHLPYLQVSPERREVHRIADGKDPVLVDLLQGRFQQSFTQKIIPVQVRMSINQHFPHP